MADVARDPQASGRRRDGRDAPGAHAAAPTPRATADHGHAAGRVALTLAALGVVFGDIGTSPLYALQAVFHADHGAVPATQAPSTASSRSSSGPSRSSSRSST